MSKITVVDDDYASEILVENLRFRGHDVYRLRTVDEALSEMDRVIGSDLIILGLIMEPSSSASGSAIVPSGMIRTRQHGYSPSSSTSR